MVAVTNGDGGDSIRNVLDSATSDNLAYSARLNWAFLKPHRLQGGRDPSEHLRLVRRGRRVGALLRGPPRRRHSGLPHTALYDRLAAGLDLALGYGGFSFTGAFTYVDLTGSDVFCRRAVDAVAGAGRLPLPRARPWEIAARWSAYPRTIEDGGR